MLNKVVRKNSEKLGEKQMRNLGVYLSMLRKDLGMSLRTVGGLSGISFAHLSKIEQGTIFNSVGINVLMRLSSVYHIPLSSIFEESGFTKSSAGNLPEFAQYLRSKYNLPAQAIRDLETAKEIVERKYIHKSAQLDLFK